MYRHPDLGDELRSLGYRPPGCLLGVFGVAASGMGVCILVLVFGALFAGSIRLEGSTYALLGSGLAVLAPGAVACLQAWRRHAEHVSYVLYESGVVRRSRSSSHVFRWADFVKLTCIRVPAPIQTFVLETRTGDEVEISAATLRGVDSEMNELLAKLTGLEIQMVPDRPLEAAKTS